MQQKNWFFSYLDPPPNLVLNFKLEENSTKKKPDTDVSQVFGLEKSKFFY